MDKIKNSAELKEAIRKLEEKQAREWQELKAQTDMSLANTSPFGVIKNVVSDAVSLKNEEAPDMWITALSMLVGYGAKRLVVQDSDSKMRELLGTAVQFGVTNLVANNSHVIKFAAVRALDLLSPSHPESGEESSKKE